VGAWKLEKGALIGSPSEPQGRAILQTSITLPDEYDLTLVLERTEGLNNFWLGLVGGGKSFMLHFDAYGGTVSGPQPLDGKDVKANGVGVKERLLTNGKPRTVVVLVRKNSLTVQADGKEFLAWKTDWSRVTPEPEVRPKDPKALWMGVSGTTYKVHRMTLSFPKN